MRDSGSEREPPIGMAAAVFGTISSGTQNGLICPAPDFPAGGRLADYQAAVIRRSRVVVRGRVPRRDR